MSKYFILVRCVTDMQCYSDDRKENADAWAIHRPKSPDMILACVYVSFIDVFHICLFYLLCGLVTFTETIILTHPYLKYNSRESNNH